MISAFGCIEGLQQMSRNSDENKAKRSKKFLIAILLGTLALLALAHFYAKPKISAGLIGMGAVSLWMAQYYFFTKRPIYRKGGPFIEFEKEPGNHTSAVLASCVLGLIFIYLGTAIFLSH